jgi:hypothetical protein
VASCNINHLLHYRCQEIKKQIKNGQNISETLKDHFKKVSWHLQRLYRFRNGIVHAAHFSAKPILTYIKNLREYISILIIEVVYQFDKFDYTHIEEVFAAIEDNYFAIVDVFEQNCRYDLDILIDGLLIK